MKRALRLVMKRLATLTTRGFDTGAHVTRYVMYERLSEYAGKLEGEKVLSISHSERLCGLLGFPEDTITDASYPEINILDLPFDDEMFDCVVSDQVFEHVEGSPHAAFEESLRVIKPGGYAVHTTCFVNPIHNHPGDYWRYTPDGLANLAKGKAKVLEVAGWGNALVWPYVFLGLRRVPIPRAKGHPLHWLATYNQQNWPISTWIIAQKL